MKFTGLYLDNNFMFEISNIINDTLLTRINSIRDLGILLEYNMSFSSHIN